jgi:hypothetical protein
VAEWITGDIARWEVIWWSKKGKKFIVKEFENDLVSAEQLYSRITALGAPFATLRCCNVGFAPPTQYRPYIKRMVKKEKVRRNGRLRTKKTIVEIEVTPMVEMNLKGIWWCPYCRKMRKFRKQDGMTYSDSSGDYYLDGAVYVDPVCGITHTNHHVRKWNPTAQKMPFRKIKGTRARRSSATRTRRTRRR